MSSYARGQDAYGGARKRSRFSDNGPAPNDGGDGNSKRRLDPLERARQIAARLAGGGGGGGGWGGGSGNMHAGGSSSRGNIVMRKKVYVPQRENPAVNYIGLILGPRGSTIKHLQESTGANIYLRGRGSSKTGENEDDDDLHVLIVSSSEDALKKAERSVKDIIFDTSKQADLKGRQLNQLSSSRREMGSGANSMPLGGQRRDLSGSETVPVEIPGDCVGAIIGKGGESIRRIMHQSNCHVQMQPSSEVRRGDARMAYLRGNPEAIATAKRIIEDIIRSKREEMQNRKPPVEGPSQKVKIPHHHVGLLIGKGGETIKAIQARTQCNVDIPKLADVDDPQHRTISITGPSEAHLKSCAEAVLDVFRPKQPAAGFSGGADQEQHEQLVTVMYILKNENVDYIVGKEGDTLTMIQDISGARVVIPVDATPEGTRKVLVTGTQAAVDVALHEMNTICIAGGEDGRSASTIYGSGLHQQYNPHQHQQHPAVSYTPELWQQWKEYYLQYGYVLPDNPPPPGEVCIPLATPQTGGVASSPLAANSHQNHLHRAVAPSVGPPGVGPPGVGPPGVGPPGV